MTLKGNDPMVVFYDKTRFKRKPQQWLMSEGIRRRWLQLTALDRHRVRAPWRGRLSKPEGAEEAAEAAEYV